jgi:hypothetical protein
MNITEIKNVKTGNIDYQKFVPNTIEQAKISSVEQNKYSKIIDKNDVKIPNNWKQEILMQGLDLLENKMQVNNNSTSYILDLPENAPIETFEEAIRELKLLDTELFLKQALEAQANISPQIVFELLTEIS